MVLPLLAPLFGGIAGLLGGGAAAAGGAGAAAAPLAAGGIAGLLGGLGGWGLPLGLMGVSMLDRMMTPDPEEEEEEKRKKYRFAQAYDPRTGAVTGGYTDLGMVNGPISGDVPMYMKDGGLIKGYADGGMIGEGDGFDPMQAGIASLSRGGGQSAMRQVDRQIVQQAIMALTGQLPQEPHISMFMQRFGKPALADLAQRVVEMEGQSPEEGMMVSGPGDGVSDSIPGKAGQMPLRLSDGEVVIPADAVSSLGNGSTRAGADELMNMVRRIRREKNGSSQQPPAIEPAQYMPS